MKPENWPETVYKVVRKIRSVDGTYRFVSSITTGAYQLVYDLWEVTDANDAIPKSQIFAFGFMNEAQFSARCLTNRYVLRCLAPTKARQTTAENYTKPDTWADWWVSRKLAEGPQPTSYGTVVVPKIYPVSIVDHYGRGKYRPLNLVTDRYLPKDPKFGG